MSSSIYEKMDWSKKSIIRTRTGSRSTRPFQRFIPDKIANTGEDPKRKLVEFIKKDIIKPLSSKLMIKDENSSNDLSILNKKWALNTAKICTSPNKLPKLQPFKDYNFVKVDPLQADNYKKSYFKTDHISVKVPTSENKENTVSFVEKKGK